MAKNNLVCTFKSSGVNKNYYENNKERLLEYGSEYYKQNKEKCKQYSREYAKKNKAYYRAKESLRDKRTKQATPPWIKIKDLESIYKNCPFNFEVDHIIPLTHKDVCSLNVPWNLQYLTSEDNRIKSNSFDKTKKNDGWKKKRGG